MKPIIRKEALILEETRAELGKALDAPLRKCAAIAVVENPLAGSRVEDLSTLGALGAEVAKLLVQNALEALGIEPGAVHSYGKAAVTGVNGELEHGSAMLHMAFDAPVREALGDTLSIIPSSEKVGGVGCTMDVPLHSKRAMKVRSHYDGMEVRLEDAPRPNEILLILCITDGPRPFPRVGGLQLDGVTALDGVS